MYQAHIFFESYEDKWDEGETGKIANSWDYTLSGSTKEGLKSLICEATFSKWDEMEHADLNDYPDSCEHFASYYADENNVGQATKDQIEQWKAGKLRLWSVNCHILVSEITKTKSEL